MVGRPAPARSLALICDDPDAPMGTWSHWVVFNLPPQVKGLKEGVPAEETIPRLSRRDPAGRRGAGKARQGKNDFGKIGYGGPCPPSGTHRYFFRLYALDGSSNWAPRPRARMYSRRSRAISWRRVG